MQELPALITAITALLGAVGGIVAVLKHKSGPAHKPPAPRPPVPPAPRP